MRSHLLSLPVVLLAGLAAAADPAPLPAGAFARLGSTTWRHPDQPLAVAAHPDGKVVASGGYDGQVRVWDVATGRVLHAIRRKDAAVSGLAYSADGKWLVAYFQDETLRFYATDRYAEERVLPMKAAEQVSLSADGSLLAATGPLGQPVLVEAATGQERMELPRGRAVAVRPDGKAVAVALENETVQVLEVPSGKPLRAYPRGKDDPNAVAFLAFHPAGERLAVATAGKSPAVRVFDLTATEPRFTADGEGPVAFVGETAVVGRSGGRLTVWDGTTGKRARAMGDGVTTFGVSAAGVAVTDGGVGFPSPRVFLWDLKTGQSRNRAADEVVDVRGVAPHPAGGLAVAAGGKLLRWTPGEARPADAGVDGVRAAVRWGNTLAVATEGEKVFALTAPDKPFANLPVGVRLLASDAAGTVLACSTTDDASPQLAVVDAARGAAVRAWPLPARPLAIAVDPAGKRVAVLGRDGYARVWAADADGNGMTPPELWKERTARSFRGGIAFTPDGKRLAFTSLMRVSVCDAATGKQLLTFERQWDDGPFTSLAVSPDGRFVAAGTQGTGGAAVVWELLTRQRAGRFVSGTGTVTAVAFLDGGHTLVTAGADDNLLAWDRTGRRGKMPPSADDLAAAWLKLGDIDPEAAYPAVATLRGGGQATLPFVLARLAEEKELAAALARRVAELDAKEFAVREAATKELVAAGGPALAALDAAEKDARSPEWVQRAKAVRGRIQMAAEALPDPSLVGVPLRRLRAVAVLEGLPGAASALEALRALGGPAGEDAARVLGGMKR